MTSDWWYFGTFSVLQHQYQQLHHVLDDTVLASVSYFSAIENKRIVAYRMWCLINRDLDFISPHISFKHRYDMPVKIVYIEREVCAPKQTI